MSELSFLRDGLAYPTFLGPVLPLLFVDPQRSPPLTEGAITVRDVAAYLNVTEKTVYRLAQRGALPGFKVAGAWRFWRRDIDAWIEVQKRAAMVAEGGS
jgi:excisionase family DNA binding protein